VRAKTLLLAAGIAGLDLLGACHRGSTAEYSGPITGTLSLAEGSGAVLGTNGTPAVGFAMTATLGGAVIVAPANATWQCLAPQPPLHPDYNILAESASNYVFALVITTSHWHSGTVAVDNSNVVLQLSLPDRFGIGTNGSLTLTTGASCSFKAEGVKLAGDQESPTAGGGGGGF
jgi:hypothetical protein